LHSVTGVQTCALPIFANAKIGSSCGSRISKLVVLRSSLDYTKMRKRDRVLTAKVQQITGKHDGAVDVRR